MAPVTELIFGCQILVRKCTLRNKIKQIIIALKPHTGQMDAKPVYSNMHKTKVREDKLPTLNSMETYVRLWSILLIKVNKKTTDYNISMFTAFTEQEVMSLKSFTSSLN